MPPIKILLLDALKDLGQDHFDEFKMHLNTKISDRWKPIAKSHLETPSRIKVVETMINHYDEKSAASLTLEVLRLIPNNEVANKLESALRGEETPAASTSSAAPAAPAAPAPAAAAPANITAQGGSVVFAPTIINSSPGTWTTNFNK